VGHKGRKKRNDLYDEECQIKEEERNKVRIKMLNRRTRMNTLLTYLFHGAESFLRS